MWKRSDLKKRGKAAFQKNYWKTVLVVLILTLLIGGGSGSASGFGSSASGAGTAVTALGGLASTDEDIDTGDSTFPDLTEDGGDDIDELPAEDEFETDDQLEPMQMASVLLAVLAFGGIILLVVLGVALAIDIFILNPLHVGANRFLIKNLTEKAQIRELAYAFDKNYLNTVKIMFLKHLFAGLWTLLFIIPGIVKRYEYRMIPYLLAENPDLTKDEAFSRSREMMRGNKWKAFLLDLSFIPWNLLSLITLGIVGVFYVEPYKEETGAALYEALKHNGMDEAETLDSGVQELIAVNSTEPDTNDTPDQL